MSNRYWDFCFVLFCFPLKFKITEKVCGYLLSYLSLLQTQWLNHSSQCSPHICQTLYFDKAIQYYLPLSITSSPSLSFFFFFFFFPPRLIRENLCYANKRHFYYSCWKEKKSKREEKIISAQRFYSAQKKNSQWSEFLRIAYHIACVTKVSLRWFFDSSQIRPVLSCFSLASY